MTQLFITKKEKILVNSLASSILLLLFVSVSYKLINGYNLAVSDRQFDLLKQANNEPQFSFSDCYWVTNHSTLFVLFSVFIFLTSFLIKKYSDNFLLTKVSVFLLILTILDATYLNIWFSEIFGIKWNAALIANNLIEIALYPLFFLLIIFQIKINFRFAKQKFQAKISLK